MRQLLAGIVMFAALAVSACNQSESPPAPNVEGQSVPSLPGLAGDPSVSVRGVKVTGGLSPADAVVGLQEALPFVQQALQHNEIEGQMPGGSFAISFVTEPDGMIRMVMEGENRLTGVKAAEGVEEFIADAMSNKWRFPTSGSQTIIEVEFEVGQL